MWILPIQLHTSPFVQDTKALDLDSEEFSQICEKSLTWRGKDSLQRTWLQRWKRVNWMQHLCIRTLRPSHTESFEDAWTSSQEDSLASHSVLLEIVKQLKTQDTSSLTSQTELESANLELFSSKTYKESSAVAPVTENQFSNMSSEHWKNWVTEQRQEYSQRKKSAHLTRESESSSLELAMNWGTPAANDANKTPHCEVNSNQAGLTRSVGRAEANWATPQTFDHVNIVRTPEKLARTRAEKNAGCMNLREQVHYPNMDHSRTAAQNWPTPTTAEGTKIGNQANFGQVGLSNHPSIVGQPDRAKLNKSGKNQESQQWPTPRANKVHPQITEQNREQLANRNKANLEEDIAGHCGKATGKLNPNWVEQLMGITVGWTDLGYWETESFQQQQLKHSSHLSKE